MANTRRAIRGTSKQRKLLRRKNRPWKDEVALHAGRYLLDNFWDIQKGLSEAAEEYRTHPEHHLDGCGEDCLGCLDEERADDWEHHRNMLDNIVSHNWIEV